MWQGQTGLQFFLVLLIFLLNKDDKMLNSAINGISKCINNIWQYCEEYSDKLQQGLHRLVEWADTWPSMFNAEKCENAFMLAE